jgi:adenosylcobyric acid synthase
VRGTSWHGLLESDGFRRALLRQVAAAAGRDFTPGHVCFSGVRQHRLDVLGDLVANHMDTGALLNLIDHGPPPGLPFILPGAP